MNASPKKVYQRDWKPQIDLGDHCISCFDPGVVLRPRPGERVSSFSGWASRHRCRCQPVLARPGVACGCAQSARLIGVRLCVSGCLVYLADKSEVGE